MENQEGNERPTSTVIGGGAVSFLKIYMFSHVLRLKHVISGFEFDRLRRSSQIHCLAGMHRGFCGRPTTGKRRSAPLHLVKNALFFNVLGVFLKSNVGSNLINLINFERRNRRYSALNSLAALACLIFRFTRRLRKCVLKKWPKNVYSKCLRW